MTNMESHLQLPKGMSLGLYTQLSIHRVFSCVEPPVLIPENKMILLSCLFPDYLCEGAWFRLYFHVVL